MSAFDSLHPVQFSEWFHGVPAKHVGGIVQSGQLTSSDYTKRNKTLTVRKDEAGYYAGKGGAVVTVRVPHSQAGEYLHADPHEHAIIPAPAELKRNGAKDSVRGPSTSAIKKPIPSSMIHKIEGIR